MDLLWYIPLGLLALLFFFMLRNRAYKICPWFFAYVAFGVLADIARFAVRHHLQVYVATYWITEAGYCLLGILSMYEVFRIVIRYLASRWWWIYLIFPSVVIVGTGLSLARAHVVPPQVSGLHYYIVVCEIAVRFVQVLAVPLTFIPLFGLRRHRYALGVASGFGLYSTVELLNMIKLADLGIRFKFLRGVISLVAYSLAVLIWIWFFRVPPEEPPATLEWAPLADAPRQYPG